MKTIENFFFQRKTMKISKISSNTTYYKHLKELNILGFTLDGSR